MKFFYLFLSFILHLIIANGAEWCYDVQNKNGQCKGPSEWKDEFQNCGHEKQSPVNIITCSATFDSSLKPFEFEGYDKEIDFLLINNGHTARLNPAHATIEISGGGLSGKYTFSQIHFHWGTVDNPGSEHTLNGERYAFELHIVHSKLIERSEPSGGSTESGGLAVLGFFLKEGNSNKNYQNIIDGLKKVVDTDTNTTISKVKLQDLIPEKESLKLFYRYEGSLTTPDCAETVTWTVFPEVIELSKDQMKDFYALKYGDKNPMVENFRPLQKLNGRKIFTSGVETILPLSRYLLISLFVFYLTSLS
ncbi:hypothetical protein GDO81_005789 [Engystomops pustulosus]|uniref:Carbonic anhydrase n=1 Tax=Engystomops pustulosus TaxID=76066 RepID=A0AAV7CS40_ENGPU|nr:hypothetical protein GDO81_005789 [Engystomops pustulosus]